MPKVGLPLLPRLGLTTCAAGWVAGAYGALYVFAAGNFEATGSYWIFGWPFALALVAATAAHLFLAGGFAAAGLRSPIAAVTTTNRVVTDGGRDATAAELRVALAWLPRAPIAHTLWCMTISVAVVVVLVLLEVRVARAAPNVDAIVTGGVIAILIYGGVAFSLCELLIGRPLQGLRVTAVGRGLDPYRGRTVPTWARVVVLAVPPVLALAVAMRLNAREPSTYLWLAEAALTVLSGGICSGLALLQAFAVRNAAADLSVAAARLACGEGGGLVTGAIDDHLVGVASAFNAAAGEIDRSRQMSAARYAALFEGAGDAILLIDAESGRVLEANRRAHELTGRGEHDLKSTRFVELFQPDPYEPDLAWHDLAAARWPSGARIQRADGSSCPVDVALSAIMVGERTLVQAILHDVSRRERTERELRQAVRRLEGLYHLAVTLGGTAEQVADHVTTALAELLDVPMVGVKRVIGDDAELLALAVNGEIRRGGRGPLAGTPCDPVCRERRICTFTEVAARFPGNALLDEHGIQTYVGVPIVGCRGAVDAVLFILDRRVRTVRDEDMRLLSSYAQRLARAFDEEAYAHERENLVSMLTVQNAELSSAKERLTEADRLKSEFMGMMSHELRTPLNIFIGYTELLLDATREQGALAAAEGHGEVLERMHDAAHTLTRLVEDTLSVLRLEGAGVPMNLGRVSVAALFDEIRGAERRLRGPTCVLERWQVEDGLPALVSDRLKLRQIVTNLVGNARKFTTAGAIDVRAARAGAEQLTLTVEDTGCGIAPAELPYIFDLYRQAGNGDVHDGCGIGLYIVRRYCELLGGRVDVQSEVGRGTRFTVTLPLRLGAGAERSAA